MKVYCLRYGGFGFGIDTFYKPFSLHIFFMFWEIAFYFGGGDE